MNKLELAKKEILSASPGAVLPTSLTLAEIAALTGLLPNTIDRIAVQIRRDALPAVNHDARYKALAAPVVKDFITASFENSLTFLDKTSKEHFLTLVLRASDSGHAFLIGQSSLLITQDFPQDNQVKTLVAWVYASPKDTLAKGEFALSVNKALHDNGREVLIASIHLKNDKSLRFFTRMGFRPSHLFKMRL